jgi:hypothetical protein
MVPANRILINTEYTVSAPIGNRYDFSLEVKPHTRDLVNDNHRPLYILLTIADIQHVKDISYDNILTSDSFIQTVR